MVCRVEGSLVAKGYKNRPFDGLLLLVFVD
jgi:hypothetical protein